MNKLNSWFLKFDEKTFIQKNKFQNNSRGNEILLIQTPADYYILLLFLNVIKNERLKKDISVEGLWPTIFILKQSKTIFYPLVKIYSLINFKLINRKWIKLYKSIGVEYFNSLESISVLEKCRYLFQSVNIWYNLSSKKNLINLSLSDIYCGDLIYDTYMRYRVSGTVKLRDPFLCFYIYKCLIAISSCKKIAETKNIYAYFSSYSTYIQHGIPVRVFLRFNIKVYTSGNMQQIFKQLSVDDYYQTSNHLNYSTDFEQINDKSLTLLAKKQLNDKFNGKIDKSTAYMRNSAFSNVGLISSDNLKGLDGILFLHDFFDSPHVYRKMLFNDFLEWTEHTLELISNHNLQIAVKPHPNQLPEGHFIIKRLKKKYKNIRWIEPEISNVSLFKSGIKIGISVYGTVLHELAYHGIIPICAGDNPHSSFNFLYQPLTIHEYDDLIINFNSLRLPKDYIYQIEAFFYMHNIRSKEVYDINFDSIKKLNRTCDSSVLNEFN